jgi:hypothetical protein
MRRRGGQAIIGTVGRPVKACAMYALFMLQSVLRTISAVMGGFGVFYLIMSWSAPALCGLALVLIGAASAIAYFVDR